jgi:hypothetical protein
MFIGSPSGIRVVLITQKQIAKIRTPIVPGERMSAPDRDSGHDNRQWHRDGDHDGDALILSHHMMIT